MFVFLIKHWKVSSLGKCQLLLPYNSVSNWFGWSNHNASSAIIYHKKCVNVDNFNLDNY